MNNGGAVGIYNRSGHNCSRPTSRDIVKNERNEEYQVPLTPRISATAMPRPELHKLIEILPWSVLQSAFRLEKATQIILMPLGQQDQAQFP